MKSELSSLKVYFSCFLKLCFDSHSDELTQRFIRKPPNNPQKFGLARIELVHGKDAFIAPS